MVEYTFGLIGTGKLLTAEITLLCAQFGAFGLKVCLVQISGIIFV